MRRGSWSPAYKKINTYNLEHYLIEHFGDLPLRNLSTFEIQVWLNNLVEEKDYSQSVVGSCFSNIRAITHLARKQKFLVEDPGEDVTMPLTKLAEKPVMSLNQSLASIGAITDLHDLCLMLIGIFSGPRASEAMGLQWKSWTGEALMPHGAAYEGKPAERGTLKDTHGVLRHASITTIDIVYVQVVEESVMRAVNSHAAAVLDGRTPAPQALGLKGRNIKRAHSNSESS